MTVFAYADGIIASDTRGIVLLGEHNGFHFHLQKIHPFIVDDKVYGVMTFGGEPIEESIFNSVKKLFFLHIWEMESTDKVKMEINDTLKLAVGEDKLEYIMFFTRRGYYNIIDGKHLVSVIDNKPIFYGSGANIAKTLYFGLGYSIRDCIQGAIDRDVCCGGPIDIYRTRDFKAIPINRKKRKSGENSNV